MRKRTEVFENNSKQFEFYKLQSQFGLGNKKRIFNTTEPLNYISQKEL